jgi:hypothetical protein
MSEIQTRYKTASARFKEGRVAEALQLLRDLDSDFPDNPEVLHALAVVRKKLGHIEEARNLATMLLEHHSDNRGARLLTDIDEEIKNRIAASNVSIDSRMDPAPDDNQDVGIAESRESSRSHAGESLLEERPDNLDDRIANRGHAAEEYKGCTTGTIMLLAGFFAFLIGIIGLTEGVVGLDTPEGFASAVSKFGVALLILGWIVNFILVHLISPLAAALITSTSEKSESLIEKLFPGGAEDKEKFAKILAAIFLIVAVLAIVFSL